MSQTLTSIGLFILSITAACRTRDDLPDRSTVNSISYVSTIQKSLVKADIDSINQVHFYVDVDGNREPVLSIDENYRKGAVKGVKVDDNR